MSTEDKAALMKRKLALRILVSATAGGVHDFETLKEQALRSLGGSLRVSGSQTRGSEGLVKRSVTPRAPMYVIGTSGFEALNGNPCMFSMRWLFLLKSGVETSENKAGLEQSGAGHEHSMDNSHWFYRGRVGKLITPGPNEPSGFIMTTILGIVGAIVASYLGQALGWYSAGEGAGLIGATVGAVIVLLVWGAIASRRTRVP